MAYAHNGPIRLYWREDGPPERPALLLLHALGTDLALWDRTLPYLNAHFRVLRMDTRGHGASDVPAGDYRLEQLAADALAVLDAAGAPRAVVCGLSLGGMVALQLALGAPQRLAGLICACSSAQMDRAAWEARLQSVRSGGTASIEPAALQRFFSAAFARTHPELTAGVRATLLATDAGGYAGCAAAIRDMDLLERLSAITTPTLVISGSHDVSTPYATHGARLVAGIAGARHIELDAAHMACYEAPAEFAAAIIEFCLQPSGETPGALQAGREHAFAAGLPIRREVLGEAWVERSLRQRTPFNSEFQSLITRYAWHEIWGRPGLDRRTRRLLVVAMTVALGRWEEFSLHVRAGLSQGGFTREELKEVLLQAAIYAGVPAANSAFAHAQTIIDELPE